MFDIRIGTVVPAVHAERMIPTLNGMGFESYQLSMDSLDESVSYAHVADTLLPLAGERPISCIGIYGNLLCDEKLRNRLVYAIQNVHILGCHTIGLFSGALTGEPMEASLPLFREVFTPLAHMAEDHGVQLAFENCSMGGTFGHAANNIGINGDMWERMFNEVDSTALGLEWEPCHALCQLIDPIPQLRKWASKVFHVHGKDATVAWDEIRLHGLQSSHAYVWDRTPGFGDTNWCDIMTILMQHGYAGSVDIEGYHDLVHYDDAEWSCQDVSLTYLKNCRGGQVWLPKLAYNGWRTRKP